MRTLGALTTATAILVALTGCTPEDEPTVDLDRDRVRAPVVREADPEACRQIEAQKAVNARLHKDGYAEDYSDEYDQLADAAGCD